MITVVGTGVLAGDITAAGQAAIDAAAVVASRQKTEFNSIPLCDRHTDAADFGHLDALIVDDLIELERAHKTVVFAVYGDGFTDTAAALLRSRRPDVAVIPGVAPSAGRPMGTALYSLSAYDITRDTAFDTDVPVLIYGLENRLLAGEVKLRLLSFYPPGYPVHLTTGGKTKRLTLEDIDRQKSYAGGLLALPGGNGFLSKERFTFSDLMAVMNRLTDPDGCPWDKAQTHESIRINLLEEAYEASDALSLGDIDDCIEELGDVLLQVVFHANIAERTGEYGMGDILSALCEKLVSRHTHIFGADKAQNPDEALVAWEKAKAVEKRYESLADQLDKLPDSFPATLKLQKTVKKAVKAGAALDKADVIARLNVAVKAGDAARVLSLSLVYAVIEGLDPEIVLCDCAAALKKTLEHAEKAGALKGALDNI